MAEKRRLLVNRGGSFYRTVTGTMAVWDETVTDPTDAEVADLLARVLEAGGHEGPEIFGEATGPADRYLRQVQHNLAFYRAALARDAEKAEQEQAVEAKAEEMYNAWRPHLRVNAAPWNPFNETAPAWRALARHELGGAQ